MSINTSEMKKVELTQRELDDIDIKKNLIKLGVILGVLLILIIILNLLLGDQIEIIGIQWLDKFGYTGIFLSTFLMDTFLSPVSPDFILLVSMAGDVNVLGVLSIMSFASVLAGNAGYFIGRFLGNRKIVRKRIEPYERRGHYLIEKYGIWAVIIAALTPIHFSVVSWIAGMLEMDYKQYLVGSLWRIPRFMFFYVVFSLGFSLF
ncbi:MAG: VTT domain-containing protein [Candidatus Thermoplasmatota archaeon]|nr:VTT domain-containing protein [Candidatus Thermoplasmatota archaeon]